MTEQRHSNAWATPFFSWMTVLLLSCLCWSPAWADSLDEEQLVEKATHTFTSFMEDPNLTWFQDHVKEAKALLIIPQQLKAAFFLGADGGSGVLVVRDKQTGAWSHPAFYVVGGFSFGFQWGGQAAEVILLIRTEGAIEKLYSSSFKLGGEASITAGPYGNRSGGRNLGQSGRRFSFVFAFKRGLCWRPPWKARSSLPTMRQMRPTTGKPFAPWTFSWSSPSKMTMRPIFAELSPRQPNKQERPCLCRKAPGSAFCLNGMFIPR